MRDTEHEYRDVRGATSTSAGAPGASWKSTTRRARVDERAGQPHDDKASCGRRPGKVRARRLGTSLRRHGQRDDAPLGREIQGEGGLSSGRTPKSSAGRRA